MPFNTDDLQVWTFDAGPGDDWSADDEFFRAQDVRDLMAQHEKFLREHLASELRAKADQLGDGASATATAIRAVVAEGYTRAAAHIQQKEQA